MNERSKDVLMSLTAPRSSRISGFYRLDRRARLAELVARGFVTAEDAEVLGSAAALSTERADSMIENVVGCFSLPLGVAVNFTVNGAEYVVPMAVEEPSIVAAVSHAAGVVRQSGGFTVEVDRSVMTGQIQVVGLTDLAAARARVESASASLLERANAIEPGMVKRGGGAVGIEVRELPGQGRFGHMLVVHVFFDACDAMGANLVNTVCEGLAESVEQLTGGTVFLRILSNLTDRRRVRARCRIAVDDLRWQGFTGAAVADGIVAASEFAERDPYRAATHNKGIMNGVDAVAVACGQDWRALEAGAHAFASMSGTYGPLARWWRDADGRLCGELDMPMAVGVVGGPIRLHPTVQACLRLLGSPTARELAAVMGAVGLAQNLAAIKALGSTGIQKGHMALHARSVAATAGATAGEVDQVARELVGRGTFKVEDAVQVLATVRAR